MCIRDRYIDLNKVTKKYEGLDGTELAISESQERMAVALAPEDVDKFIASFFRNPAVTEAVRDLLQHRDGLMLGICNGFQALIKLGLAAYGDIRPITACDPTLTLSLIHI